MSACEPGYYITERNAAGKRVRRKVSEEEYRTELRASGIEVNVFEGLGCIVEIESGPAPSHDEMKAFLKHYGENMERAKEAFREIGILEEGSGTIEWPPKS